MVPRSNRPRSGRPRDDGDDELDLSKVLYGALRIESKRGGTFNVQSVSASSAAKVYTCPGCGLDITPGTPHIVAWRADGLMGAEDDLAARRHWHPHCWKIA
jgi:hypothetical protein